MQDVAEPPPEVRGPSGVVKLLVTALVLALVAAVWVLTARPGPRAVLWRTWWPSSMLVNLAATAGGLAFLYLVFGGGRRALRVLRLGLLAGVLAIVVLALEAPVLFGDHDWGVLLGDDPEQVWLQRAAGINRPDPELIHLHWPDSSWKGEVTGNLAALGIPRPRRYPVSVRYDGRGFRNPVTHESARVAVVGDSFVEAAILPLEDGLVARLGRRLEAPVVNLGQAAYGLEQELVVLRRFALPLRPRVVVWCFFGGNDLRDVETYARQREGFGQPAPPRPREQRSFLVNALELLSRLTVSERTAPTAEALARSATFRSAGGSTDRVWFGQTNGPWTARQWTVMTETLTEARRLCREASAELLVVYIPRKFRVYRDHVEAAPESLVAGWQVNDLPRAMATWCAETDLPFLDLTPPLREEVAAGRHPYLLDDVHWNARGHEIAAALIAGWIERRDLHREPPK